MSQSRKFLHESEHGCIYNQSSESLLIWRRVGLSAASGQRPGPRFGAAAICLSDHRGPGQDFRQKSHILPLTKIPHPAETRAVRPGPPLERAAESVGSLLRCGGWAHRSCREPGRLRVHRGAEYGDLRVHRSAELASWR